MFTIREPRPSTSASYASGIQLIQEGNILPNDVIRDNKQRPESTTNTAQKATLHQDIDVFEPIDFSLNASQPDLSDMLIEDPSWGILLNNLMKENNPGWDAILNNIEDNDQKPESTTNTAQKATLHQDIDVFEPIDFSLNASQIAAKGNYKKSADHGAVTNHFMANIDPDLLTSLQSAGRNEAANISARARRRKEAANISAHARRRMANIDLLTRLQSAGRNKEGWKKL